MEKAKQVSGSSSSITMDDLFGPRISSKSSSSTTTLFESIFGPPPPTVYGKNSSHSDTIRSSGKKDLEIEQGTSEYMDMGEFKKDRNSIDENGKNIEPCYFNSSIYYGGQEVYSPTSQKNTFKKDEEKLDSNENGSHSASRGNWWQGSLYY
ncbi:Hypothetical predicted protein [Olea europaea subsp. europaea]|uniref:Uncharacterized protein n=1 Tax=Olea europaea subsp. europaea TaxID=158383 RepID=A0A8S0QYA1_OLEEU|nr:Hypothetical predicted protein [Olea europaea subsp. europaea]